jgi:hypothetical protein
MASGSVIGFPHALQLFRYAEAVLPPPLHRSLPVPVVEDRRLRAAVMYARGEIVSPKDGFQIWPPSHVAYVDLKVGRFESLRAVRPRLDFGLNDDPKKPLGRWLSPGERLEPALMEQMALYLQACDEAVAAFGADAPSEAGLASVRAFLTTFQALSEKPLAAYYLALSPQFFAWAKRVAPAR